MEFMLGGLAGIGAGIFSNPFDVVKTRMQLQGELQKKGKHAVHYKNIPHAMINIVKHDGIGALQQGLAPALWFQWVVNGSRLGLYQVADNYGLLRDENGKTTFWSGLFFGGLTGMIGGLLGSPLQLIKTQLMSASAQQIAVGTQHAHPSMLSALKTVMKRGGGFKGLWRGAHGMMVRNGIGSASQMVTFSMCKEYLDANNMFQQGKYTSAFVASNLGALTKTIALTPMDVIMTRLYNQALDKKGRGKLYTGIIDCAKKITTHEGPLAFYKGMGPSYFRQAPHTVLLLIFWDILKDLAEEYGLK